jgi:hypothetical protein
MLCIVCDAESSQNWRSHSSRKIQIRQSSLELYGNSPKLQNSISEVFSVERVASNLMKQLYFSLATGC